MPSPAEPLQRDDSPELPHENAEFAPPTPPPTALRMVAQHAQPLASGLNSATSTAKKRARPDTPAVNASTEPDPKRTKQTPTAPAAPSNFPKFADTYVSGRRAKASDYDDISQAIILRTMREYESRIVGVYAFPDTPQATKWVSRCWKSSNQIAGEKFDITDRILKLVSHCCLPQYYVANSYSVCLNSD